MRCWPCAINSGLGSENESEKGRHLTDVLGFLQRPRGFTRRAMNLLKAVATVSSMTLISRILGFVRDLVIARVFGAGFVTDAFFVAFKLPNFLRRLFAEGAFSQAFVPVLAEYKNRRGEAETRLLVDRVATRSEEHTSELQSRLHLVCRLLLEKKKINHLLPLYFS